MKKKYILYGIGDVSLELAPDYVPEKDTRILCAIEKWKN